MMEAIIINSIIPLNTGSAPIIASGTLLSTIDHPASATYCKATKNTARLKNPTYDVVKFISIYLK